MNLMNINALIALSFLSSCMAAWLIYTRQKMGRMGFAAIPSLVLAGVGVYAGSDLVLQTQGQIPSWFSIGYSLIPLYFLVVAGYWVMSLRATWRNLSFLWETVKQWRLSDSPRREAIRNITGALKSQGCAVSPFVAFCLFYLAPKKSKQTITYQPVAEK